MDIDPAANRRRPYMFGAHFEYASHDDRVFASNGASDSIAVRSPDGAALPAVRLLRARHPVTQDVKQALDSARAALRAAAGAPQQEGPTSSIIVYADSMPSHSRLITDRDGRLWVYDYPSFPPGAEAGFTIFDRDGHAIARARIPVELTDKLWIGAREAVVVARDSLGIEQVRVYPIVTRL